MTGPSSQRTYLALTKSERRHYEKAARALTEMRLGATLSEAARAVGTTPAVVTRYAGPWLSKTGAGRVRPLPRDTMVRRLRFLTPAGMTELITTDSRIATEIARYENALGRFLGGDLGALRRFEGRGLRMVGGQLRPFVTDPQTVMALARRGEVSFESLYAEID